MRRSGPSPSTPPRGREGRGPDWWRRDAVDAGTWEALQRGVADGDLVHDGFQTIMTHGELEARRWPPTTPERLAAAVALVRT